MVCVFFGHRDAPSTLRSVLRQTIEHLIVGEGVENFYVGNQGNFDLMAQQELCNAKKRYPHIIYEIVLAYPPAPFHSFALGETLYPFGLENKPRRYAIDYRNKWMVEHADIVVSYVERSWGGAAKSVRMAKRRGIRVIALPREM